MNTKGPKADRKTKKTLWGLGLDAKDGHLRVTKGENYQLVGGSQETHGAMQEKAVKLNEHLKKRGQTLETVTPEEFTDLADKLEMPLLEKPVHRKN